MNKDVKARWIDKLENGNIPQTTGKLGEVEGGRCCLGVLCDLAVQDGVIFAPSVADDEGRLMYAREVAVLPPEVMDWAGIEHSNGGFSTDPEKDPEYMDDALSFQNDCGKTFPEIAQIIRERF